MLPERLRTGEVTNLMFVAVTGLTISPAVGHEKNPPRKTYVGETSFMSVDAWMFGDLITGPDDAYEFTNP